MWLWSTIRTIIRFSTNKIKKIRLKYFHKIFKHTRNVCSFHWQERDETMEYRQCIREQCILITWPPVSVPCETVVKDYTKWHFDALNTSQMPRDPHDRRKAGTFGSAKVTRCRSHLVRETWLAVRRHRRTWDGEPLPWRKECHVTFTEFFPHLSERTIWKVAAQEERES